MIAGTLMFALALPSVQAGAKSPALVGMTLKASADTVVAGGVLSYSWTGASTTNKNDWVVFVNGNTPSRSNYLKDSWQYTHVTQLKSETSVWQCIRQACYNFFTPSKMDYYHLPSRTPSSMAFFLQCMVSHNDKRVRGPYGWWSITLRE
ncbi:hypothetical protein BC830DRAFT_1192704 [Chytriomyces sp. MP71]|nr:hypothetical protein BC830DRAFT_1192704 [Chytriomyces sp. MP71]